jgi:hypothetical protein
VLLILVGVIPYALHPVSMTALIPAFAGLLLAVLGAVALSPGARKHAMHAAVVIGLLGFLAAAGRLISGLASGKTPTALGATSLGLMALLCGLFVVLCVRSFINARRERQAAAGA